MLIEKTYIRAEVDGKWGSYSLAELVDMNRGGIAMNWVIEKMCAYQVGEVITKTHLELLMQLLSPDRYVRLK